jgi:hypothetical protein
MTQSDRARVLFHGAIVMLIGMLCGLPTVPEQEPMRLWHMAHEAQIMLGVIMITVSSAMPVLALERREGRALIWMSLAMGYGLMVGTIMQAMLGHVAFSPSTNPWLMAAFIANVIGILGSVMTASLTIMGARAAHVAALRAEPAGSRS